MRARHSTGSDLAAAQQELINTYMDPFFGQQHSLPQQRLHNRLYAVETELADRRQRYAVDAAEPGDRSSRIGAGEAAEARHLDSRSTYDTGELEELAAALREACSLAAALAGAREAAAAARHEAASLRSLLEQADDLALQQLAAQARVLSELHAQELAAARAPPPARAGASEAVPTPTPATPTQQQQQHSQRRADQRAGLLDDAVSTTAEAASASDAAADRASHSAIPATPAFEFDHAGAPASPVSARWPGAPRSSGRAEGAPSATTPRATHRTDALAAADERRRESSGGGGGATSSPRRPVSLLPATLNGGGGGGGEARPHTARPSSLRHTNASARRGEHAAPAEAVERARRRNTGGEASRPHTAAAPPSPRGVFTPASASALLASRSPRPNHHPAALPAWSAERGIDPLVRAVAASLGIALPASLERRDGAAGEWGGEGRTPRGGAHTWR